MYYNHITLCGRISIDPTIRTSKSGKNFVSTRLGVRRGIKKGAKYDNFNLIAYGDVGNEMLEKVKEGDFICVGGPLNGEGFTTAEGKPGVNLSVVVQKWEKDPTVEYPKEAEKEMMAGGGNTEGVEEENEEFLF